MALTNLRKSIFYLQQAIRERGDKDRDLLDALGLMSKVETKNADVNDPDHYNTTDI